MKFFNKIRQKLLSEGKVSKYYKYAFGEIVLVMIGILLALQVNNWNDNRKKREVENQYYCKLLEDFELDRLQIASIQKSLDKSIENSNEMLLELDAVNRTRKYLMNKHISAIRRDIYVPRNKTFEELIYTGNLNLISDLKVKNVLIEYDSEMESKLTIIRKNRDAFVQELYKLTNASIDFGLQESDVVGEYLTPEVINTLPGDNWTKDKNSDIFKNFQKFLIYNVAVAGREKQILNLIIEMMETPQKLLETKCVVER